MPEFEISEKELWLSALVDVGVPVVTETDGSRWIEADILFDYLARVRDGLNGPLRIGGGNAT